VKYRHQPDFTIKAPDGKELYLEYLGIDRAGNTAPGIDRTAYHRTIDWKRSAHAECGTTLLELTYQDLKDGILTTKLESLLREHGLEPQPRPVTEIIAQAESLGYLSRLGQLCRTFIQHARAQRLDAAHWRAARTGDMRTASFLSIATRLLEWYEDELMRLEMPDFAAMIHEAADLLERGEVPFPYSHVLVDEYQDIARDRQRLLDAVRSARPGLEITTVGDDWQAINRFAGSDLSIMRRASKPKFDRKLVPLHETHRLPQALADVSSRFVQKNPEQLRKQIVATRNVNGPNLFLHWDTNATDTKANLEKVIARIGDANQVDTELLVVARYNDDLPDRRLVERLWRGPAEVRTIHSSKGTEADYVIVMDLTQDRRGFPSTIVDDPVLRLVLPEQERFEHAEERRLFYVALTRARLACHLVTPTECPSLFTLELERERLGEHLGREATARLSCPVCHSGQQVSAAADGSVRCSNAPLCDFVTPKCPKCDQPTVLISSSPCVYRCNIHADVTFDPCPACTWGMLVTRSGPFGQFRSCHTWPKTRCPGKSDPRRR
jgi:DNA helicase-4